MNCSEDSAKDKELILIETDVQDKIYLICSCSVMLDSDLAELYGVETRVLNQAVSRNSDRFPEDFMFQLTTDKWQSLTSQIVQKAAELKLTAKGNLPIAVCILLVKKNLIDWKYMKYVKILSEDNIPYIWPIKEYLTTEGLIKKRNNKLSVTKKGEKYPKLAHSERLQQLLSFFTARFNWRIFTA